MAGFIRRYGPGFALLLVAVLLFPAVVRCQKPAGFSEIGREAARFLGDLVRLDTTNPPGNESLVVDYLADILDREGIHYTRLARDQGRDNLIARYHGSGKKQPLLLYSHSDVVPADPGWGAWTAPPFSGEVRDGALYGRGAIDSKGLLVCQLAALILLKRRNVPLDRDVILLVAAAEETGGGPGISWLLKEKAESIDAETALGEGGRVWERGDSVWTVWIQAGEKSAHNLTVTAVGRAGHASVPSSHNAIETLVRALSVLQNYSFPEKTNPVSKEFFKRISDYDPRVSEEFPRFEAMKRTTLSVTMINGGVKSNVIPPFAEANIDLRLLPGEDLDKVTRALQDAVKDTGVTIRHKPGAVNYARTVPFDTPFFKSISSTAAGIWPRAVVAPYLTPGTTDASKLRSAGILAYGLMPFPLTEKEARGVHGVDERVRLKSINDGVRLTYEIILDWAAPTNHK